MNPPREELKAKVLRLLQEIAPEIDPGQINLSRPLRDQVDIDSMDFFNFVARIYETLGVNIPESEFSRLRSLEDLLHYLQDHGADGH